jgi:hypothetical protein
MVIGRGRRREHLIYENKRGWFPMVIERRRRREHPQPTFAVLLLRKKYGKK